jgi:hypothetical protein
MTPSCKTCIYGYCCSADDEGNRTYPRDDCLKDNEEGKFSYKHYVEGDPNKRYDDLRNSGAINIVIGGEGEHEMNAKWDIHTAYKKLAYTCENVGGLVTKRTDYSLELCKPYDNGFWVIEWMHGKLYKLTKMIPKDYWVAP